MFSGSRDVCVFTNANVNGGNVTSQLIGRYLAFAYANPVSPVSLLSMYVHCNDYCVRIYIK